MNGAPIRPATVADADTIAALHAASWRSAYRGIFKESTLGPTLDGERRTHWSGKLTAMVPDDTVLIAGDLGFIAVWAKGDPAASTRSMAPRSRTVASSGATPRSWPMPAL